MSKVVSSLTGFGMLMRRYADEEVETHSSLVVVRYTMNLKFISLVPSADPDSGAFISIYKTSDEPECT